MKRLTHLLPALLLAIAALTGMAHVRAQDASHIGYFLAPDSSGIRQVYQIGISPNVAPRVITHAQADVLAYGASYDGLSVAYVSGNQLWLQTIHTDTPEALASVQPTDYPGGPVFSPDGRYMAYADAGISLIDLGTRQSHQLVADIQLNTTTANFGDIRLYRPEQFIVGADGKAAKLIVKIGLWESDTVGVINLATNTVQEVADRSHDQLLPISGSRTLLYGNTPLEGEQTLRIVPQLDDLKTSTVVADFRQLSSQSLYASMAVLTAPNSVRVVGTTVTSDGPGLFFFDYDLSTGTAANVSILFLGLFGDADYTFPDALSPDGKLLVLEDSSIGSAQPIEILIPTLNALAPTTFPDDASDFQWQPQ